MGQPKSKSFSWDDVQLGVQLQLAQITKGNLRKKYLKSTQEYCDMLLKLEAKRNSSSISGNIKITKKGLLFINEWSPLRYSTSSAFVCLLVDKLSNNNKYRAMRSGVAKK